ncbi:unnamed protein product [Protopolystoma xenopodis]|uniref:Uncharacterized protein n=1 Tax=Protopolystoma xenopodis TaxID=117903 RepID=A0A448XJF9_9PLAT|nr:unnamed protein product [Protopolystoma xenopodis]
MFQWSVLLFLTIIANMMAVCIRGDLFINSRKQGYDPHQLDEVPSKEALIQMENSEIEIVFEDEDRETQL